MAWVNFAAEAKLLADVRPAVGTPEYKVWEQKRDARMDELDAEFRKFNRRAFWNASTINIVYGPNQPKEWTPAYAPNEKGDGH